MSSQQRAPTLAIACGTASMNTGQVIVFSLLPLICISLGLEGWHAGLILSISSLCFALVSPIWGRLSERYDRVPILSIGLVGYSLGTLGFALLLDYGSIEQFGLTTFLGLLIIVRSMQSLLMGAIIPASTAYIVDTTPPEKMAQGMATLGAAQNIGAIIGPITVSLLSSIALLSSFYAAAVFTTVTSLLVWFMGDKNRTAGKAHIDIQIWTLVRNIFSNFTDPRYRVFCLCGIGIFASFGTIQQPLGIWLQLTQSLSEQDAAHLMGLAMLSMALCGALFQLFIVPRLGLSPKRYLVPGFLIMGTGATVIVSGQSTPSLLIGMGLMGIGLSIAFVGYSGELNSRVNADERGQAGGVIGATPAFGFMLGPLIGAIAYEYSPHLPFVIAISLCTGLAVLSIIESHRYAKIFTS